MSNYVVCAMYTFAKLEGFEIMKAPLLRVMLDNNVKGTLLIAKEGINGTVAGDQQGIDNLLNYLESDSRLSGLGHKESYHDEMPFNRTKVKLKKEIVTLGVEGVDPNEICGQYVKPQDWNDLISDPEVVVVDTRNDYEVEIGTFKNALNPNTENFREFPNYVAGNLDKNKHKKIAMFCTGGIRCEKSTAFMKSQGFKEVYHLEGGILKYLEEVPEKESLWEGECFVFDSRVAVNHSLEKGKYDQCFACRMPITEEEKLKTEYVKGVSCHHCQNKNTESQKERFLEREKQSNLSKARGEEHLGSEVKSISKERHQQKMELKEKNRQLNK
jgi:UPF0176 protein